MFLKKIRLIKQQLNFDNFKSNKFLLIFVILIFLLYLLIFVSSFSTNFKGISNYYGARDADLYVKMAYQLIDKGIYGYNSSTSNAYVTPSQPFYITSILMLNKILNINDMLLITIFNLLLNIGSIILLFFISLQLFKNKKISFIASLLFATYFSNVYFIRAALTEVPAIFFMLLSIFIFIKAIKKDKPLLYMLFSIIYAITIMFRPALAPLLLIGFFIIWKKFGLKSGTKRLLYFGVGFVLIILPWIIRNYLLFNQLFIFSSHSGNPFLGGTYPFYLEECQPAIAQELGMSQMDYGKYRLMEGFKTDPKLYISWFTLGKFLWLFGGPSSWLYYSSNYSFLTIFIYLQHFLILFFGLFCILKHFKKNNGIKVLSCLVIMYIIIHFGFIAIPRFGYLIFPILSILASYTLVSIYNYIKLINYNELKLKIVEFCKR
jgi:4-amino-4-deoxy-L-arabinose transferase-like glycosyltransferase